MNHKVKNKTLQHFLEVGLLFGSGFWGCDNPQDWDIAISGDEWRNRIGNDLDDFYYNQREYNGDPDFNCFYIKDGKNLYNILVFWNIEELQVYKKASRIMNLIPVIFYQNKEDRVRLFNTLKEIVRNKCKREN